MAQFLFQDRTLSLLLLPTHHIATGRKSCFNHIMVKTQGFQHPYCIGFEIDVKSGNYRTNSASVDTSVYSRGWNVSVSDVYNTEGSFDVNFAWVAGHSPYPEIENMQFWVFSKHFDSVSVPLQSKWQQCDSKNNYKYEYEEHWHKVCTVKIEKTGQVFVDSESMGVWGEFTSLIKSDNK